MTYKDPFRFVRVVPPGQAMNLGIMDRTGKFIWTPIVIEKNILEPHYFYPKIRTGLQWCFDNTEWLGAWELLVTGGGYCLAFQRGNDALIFNLTKQY